MSGLQNSLSMIGVLIRWTLADPKKKILKIGVSEIMAIMQEDYES